MAVECWWEVPGERKAPPDGALEWHGVVGGARWPSCEQRPASQLSEEMDLRMGAADRQPAGPRPGRHARGQAVTSSWSKRCSGSARARCPQRVRRSTSRRAHRRLGAEMERSMSAPASALDVVGAITRDAPEPAFPARVMPTPWASFSCAAVQRSARAVGGERAPCCDRSSPTGIDADVIDLGCIVLTLPNVPPLLAQLLPAEEHYAGVARERGPDLTSGGWPPGEAPGQQERSGHAEPAAVCHSGVVSASTWCCYLTLLALAAILVCSRCCSGPVADDRLPDSSSWLPS